MMLTMARNTHSFIHTTPPVFPIQCSHIVSMCVWEIFRKFFWKLYHLLSIVHIKLCEKNGKEINADKPEIRRERWNGGWWAKVVVKNKWKMKKKAALAPQHD